MSRGSQQRLLGTTSISVSALGAGTASLGGLFGPIADGAAVELLTACIDAGITYLDTAPLYGNGLAEQRLGDGLRELGQPPFTISTKVGRTLDPAAPEGRRYDFSRDGILRGLESSLERLGRDRVDIVYLHDPDDFEQQVYSDAWPTLEELRSQGVVGAIGVGMNQWQLPLRFVERLDIDVVMLAGRYTLLDASAGAEFLPACEAAGVAVVLAGVFNSGVLVDPVDGAWYDYQPASAELLQRARRMRDVAAEYGVTLPQLALEFAFANTAAASVVVGVGSASTLRRNLRALEQGVPAALFARLTADGLLEKWR